MSILGLLVLLILVGVVIWATQRILAAFGVGDPLKTVIFVLVVILLLVVVLSNLGVTGFGSVGRLHL